MTEGYSCDVLVVGAGGAGLRAALEAARAGAKVLVVYKPGGNATVMGGGGHAAALSLAERADTPEQHWLDIMRGGENLSNPLLARILAEEAPAQIQELASMGVEFSATAGHWRQFLSGGHTFRRNLRLAGGKCHQLMRVLKQHAVALGVGFLGGFSIIDLLIDQGLVIGALGVQARTGQTVVFRARSVVLASGGAASLYKFCTTPPGLTGTGYGLAYEAGAALLDMEFVQFLPSALIYPEKLAGMVMNDAVRGEGAFLLNSKDERFMQHYDPELKELAPRSKVAKAIYQEIRAGRGSAHGGVYLDARHLPAGRLKQDFAAFRALERFGLSSDKDLIEVAPAAHFCCGGVRIDHGGATDVSGLFAAGEVCGGIHGANRLGGNALSELQVFGSRAGRSAAAVATRVRAESEKTCREAAERVRSRYQLAAAGEGKAEIEALWQRLRQAMEAGVGLVRTAAGLKGALAGISACREELGRLAIGREALARAEELRLALLAAEMVAQAALLRQESRGTHCRADYPARDDDSWLKNIHIQKGSSGLKLTLAKAKGLD